MKFIRNPTTPKDTFKLLYILKKLSNDKYFDWKYTVFICILIHSMFKLCSLNIIKIKQTKISNIDKEKKYGQHRKNMCFSHEPNKVFEQISFR